MATIQLPPSDTTTEFDGDIIINLPTSGHSDYLRTLRDVDTSVGLATGAMLFYDEGDQFWRPSTTVDGGSY